MADPLSILGAATGVTSLIIQVTDGCVRAFKLYQEALGMPDALRYLHIRLQIEQQRFTNFGLEAGILFENGVLCAALRVNRSLLLAVLAEIKVLLTAYATLNGKYEDLVPVEHATQGSVEPGSELIDLLCTPKQDGTRNLADGATKTSRWQNFRDFGQRLAQLGRNLRTVTTDPRRLVWVKFDRESFTDLVSKIADLNTFLVSLLDTSQITRLDSLVNKAYLEILQVHSDVTSLKGLVKALGPKVHQRQPSPLTFVGVDKRLLLHANADRRQHEQATQRYLQKLVEIKIRYNQVDQPASDNTNASNAVAPELELKLDDFTAVGNGNLDDCSPDTRISVQHKGKSAWIEWKCATTTGDVSPLDVQRMEDRIQLLTRLLRYEKPEEFRAPPCLGYVKRIESDLEIQYGFVFERPAAIALDLELHTLRSLVGQVPKPSLSDRVKMCMVLARSIFNFHAVGWLHKGVRSDNVIVFTPPISSSPFEVPDWTLLSVAGFDMARPGIIDSMTEKPQFDQVKDVYRHPFAQSNQSSGRYRRSFDIYSLGIVLLEIALWKRIEDVLGFADMHRVKPWVLQEIQPWLLGRPYRSNTGLPDSSVDGRSCLQQLASECGDVFCGVVEHCLTMDEADKTQYVGESESSVAIRVQRITQEDILGRLERMALVL